MTLGICDQSTADDPDRDKLSIAASDPFIEDSILPLDHKFPPDEDNIWSVDSLKLEISGDTGDLTSVNDSNNYPGNLSNRKDGGFTSGKNPVSQDLYFL